MGFIAVGLVSLAFYIIHSQPISNVLLLPDADGGTGSVIVRTTGGLQQSVSAAYASASVNRSGVPSCSWSPSAKIAR